MVYLVKKKVKNNYYWYICRSYWDKKNKRFRTETVQYLGSVNNNKKQEIYDMLKQYKRMETRFIKIVR